MKNLIAAVLVFVSFSAFGQNKFNGDWRYETSPDVLRVNLEKQELYLYNKQTGFRSNEQIYKIKTDEYGQPKEVHTTWYGGGWTLFYKYYIKNGDLYCYDEELNETLIYKKI